MCVRSWRTVRPWSDSRRPRRAFVSPAAGRGPGLSAGRRGGRQVRGRGRDPGPAGGGPQGGGRHGAGPGEPDGGEGPARARLRPARARRGAAPYRGSPSRRGAPRRSSAAVLAGGGMMTAGWPGRPVTRAGGWAGSRASAWSTRQAAGLSPCTAKVQYVRHGPAALSWHAHVVPSCVAADATVCALQAIPWRHLMHLRCWLARAGTQRGAEAFRARIDMFPCLSP